MAFLRNYMNKFMIQPCYSCPVEYIRRSEDVLDVFLTSYVRLIYVLCMLGTFEIEIYYEEFHEILPLKFFLSKPSQLLHLNNNTKSQKMD